MIKKPLNHELSDLRQQISSMEMLEDKCQRVQLLLEHSAKELNGTVNRLEDVCTELRNLFKQRKEEDSKDNLSLYIKTIILPHIERLKKSRLTCDEMACLHIIESNLMNIVSPFTRWLSSEYKKLTPTEIQIANLVREGKTTKEIAQILNLSTRTIDTHRLNIRKKIDIKNKRVNLRSYLLSIK